MNRIALSIVFLVAIATPLVAQESVPATKDSAPAAEPVAGELSQYGITWTFAQPVRYGRFITGDLWVLGPVTVTSVAPGWDGTCNGSVVDPETSLEQGYRKEWKFSPKFNEAIQAKFPLKLEGTRSLVSTIGLAEPAKGGAYEGLDTAAVLTVVDKVPAKDAFRPAYVVGDKTIYTAGQIKWDRLPKLKVPEGANLPKFNDMMKRVWLDHYAAKGNSNATIHPRSNMPPYPGYSGREVSTMSMLVLLDIPERQELTYRMVQLGIDLQPISLKNSDAWRGYGGFGNGRKWPILFAGIMLDQAAMKSPPTTVESSNSRTGTVEKFGEDGHTYYGKPTEDYPKGKPLFGNDVPGEIFKKLMRDGINAGGDKDARDPDGLLDGPAYRDICSVTWVGPALAARLMGAQKTWNHPAFFDYVDRWIKEIGIPNPQRNAAQIVYYCWGNDFMKAMWDTYRPQADEIGKKYAPGG